jgi:hypothetical protein
MHTEWEGSVGITACLALGRAEKCGASAGIEPWFRSRLNRRLFSVLSKRLCFRLSSSILLLQNRVVTRASTWYYSVNVPLLDEGTADPSFVCRFTCILGALRRLLRHFSPHYLPHSLLPPCHFVWALARSQHLFCSWPNLLPNSEKQHCSLFSFFPSYLFFSFPFFPL